MIVNLIYLDIGIDLFLANRTCVTCLNIHISACVFCVCIIRWEWLFCTGLEVHNCVLRRQNKRISKNTFNEDLLCIKDMSTNSKPLEMTKMASFDIIRYYMEYYITHIKIQFSDILTYLFLNHIRLQIYNDGVWDIETSSYDWSKPKQFSILSIP